MSTIRGWRPSLLAVILGLFFLAAVGASAKDAKAEASSEKEDEQGKEVDLDYAKISLCGYCKYCKFCPLCKTDCPCSDKSRVGCDMCKYCKYCKVCTVCDTFCKKGGFLDSVMTRFLGSIDVDTKKADKELNDIKEYL